jgi:dCTP deaminase
MILTHSKIEQEISSGRIEIDPFQKKMLNENSYTVTLGRSVLIYTADIVDTAKKNQTVTVLIPSNGLFLEKGCFCISNIEQYIGSDYYVPILHGIPKIAKLGLFIHVTANLIDIGNHCNFSLQMHPSENIILYEGMEIAQVSFWRVSGSIKLYNGKYKNVRGPAASQSYKHTGGIR